MNPIYIEYYVHEGCECYKIDLPWTRYNKATSVLCKVEEGIEFARLIAIGVIQRHLNEVLHQSLLARMNLSK